MTTTIRLRWTGRGSPARNRPPSSGRDALLYFFGLVIVGAILVHAIPEMQTVLLSAVRDALSAQTGTLDSILSTSTQLAEKLYTSTFTTSLVAATPRWGRAGNNFPILVVGTLRVPYTSYGTRSVPTTLEQWHIGKLFLARSLVGSCPPAVFESANVFKMRGRRGDGTKEASGAAAQ